MEILLFGGTTEGRELAGWLSGRGGVVTLCVATPYGAQLSPAGPGVTVRAGRLDGAGMEALMRERPFACAVDATHPYADLVSRTLRSACGHVGLPYLRLVRGEGADGGFLHAPDAPAAAALLEGLPGNVLLTTGSKELSAFARPGLTQRCFPRVLPSLDSLERCLALGFPAAHVICMQGPFSRALNEALLRQFAVKTLVSKRSGAAGGFPEKAQAAAVCGCTLLVIDRPVREEGLGLEDMKRRLEEYLS